MGEGGEWDGPSWGREMTGCNEMRQNGTGRDKAGGVGGVGYKDWDRVGMDEMRDDTRGHEMKWDTLD